MGWVWDSAEDDLYEHEGFSRAILATGEEPAPVQIGTGHAGVTSSNSSWWLYDGSSPERPLAVGLLAACECGWRGPRMRPVDFDDPEAAEGDDYANPTGPYADWLGHIEDLRGHTVPKALSELLAAVNEQLAELAAARPLAALEAVGRLETVTQERGRAAARSAYRNGDSWTAIGRALGITKQAAHSRFYRHLGSRFVSDETR